MESPWQTRPPGLLHLAGFALPGRQSLPGHLLVVERRPTQKSEARISIRLAGERPRVVGVRGSEDLLDPHLIPFFLINDHSQG